MSTGYEVRYEQQAREILKGGYDIHIHAAPDGFLRNVDCFDAARDAAAMEMRGIVFKDHHFPTVGLAALTQKAVPQVQCFGSMTISRSTGGFNAAAVDEACKRGAKIIWFPTLETEYFVRVCSGQGSTAHLFEGADRSSFLDVLDDRGGLRQDVLEVMEVIRDAGVVCSIGHLSKEESWAVVRRAKDMGIKKLKFSHPQGDLGLNISEQREMAQMGVYLSYTFLNCVDGDESERITVEQLIDMIRTAGPEQAILSSDGGQMSAPRPQELLLQACEALLAHGLEPSFLQAMVRENPAYLLESV